MTYDRTDRIRRAAILIASLDEPLAEQLLAELSPIDAARVLAEAESLESLDPEEQEDVLAEFRRLSRGRATGSPGGVEFEYSGSQEASSADNRAAGSTPAPEPSASLSDADAAGMAELLAAEHPQIVAAALSRLGDEQSAAVFAALPVEVQAQTLERLAALAPADEESVLEVESQLHHRMQQRRELQARSAAGAELVKKILARTPAAQRTYLLERLAARDAAPASTETPATRIQFSGGDHRVNDRPPVTAIDPVAQQALNLASAVRRAHAAGAYQTPTASDHSEELEALSNEALVACLRAADEPTVLRALAASGETFLRRVTNMLPRKQAKQLRRMLRALAPTRLSDLHEAQQRLLELAYESMMAEAA